ncbi:hypothetical protein NDU88_003432 [Pleurodeles waltl]|uniref:Uncharacterized protein n=1 Tax=Pleurodeles waltl TaxID=8319 RepID=A0AAV7UDP7_PLEWA|nr:hypothetical protein NDU88_003432 [Pleurodeles waltl]
MVNPVGLAQQPQGRRTLCSSQAPDSLCLSLFTGDWYECHACKWLKRQVSAWDGRNEMPQDSARTQKKERVTAGSSRATSGARATVEPNITKRMCTCASMDANSHVQFHVERCDLSMHNARHRS